ncbi:hypothetical protein [Nisaea sp.]|uniref:hypothetical protein n=1 Tax=Nisaea sp. TaxID=2024842 RepID=UPI0032661612
MPIDVREHDGLVEFVGIDDLSANEIMSVSETYHSNSPKKLALWNLLGARISSFRASNFQKVATKGSELSRLRGPGARNAIVVGIPSEYQLLQAFSNMASAVSAVEHAVFYCREEAIAWLKSSNSGV